MAPPILSHRIEDFTYFSTHVEEFQQALATLTAQKSLFLSATDIQQFANYFSSRIYTINQTIFRKQNSKIEQREKDLTRLQIEYVSFSLNSSLFVWIDLLDDRHILAGPTLD